MNDNNEKPKRGELQSSQMPSTADVMRRLIILIGVLVGVVIYSTGWRITGINLDETQDETRQEDGHGQDPPLSFPGVQGKNVACVHSRPLLRSCIVCLWCRG